MNILIAAPHPDDDIIGCGGSMAKHAQLGHCISVVYMTSGNAGSLKINKRKLAKLREQEAIMSCAVLGIKNLFFLGNEDGYLENSKDNLIKIVGIIRDIKPSLLYIPHRNEAHRDHKTTHDLFMESTRRAIGPWFQECKGDPWAVETVLCYEVMNPLSEISYTEDITQYIDVKIAALKKHQSQIEDIHYDEAARSLSRYRGITTGRGDYCECFQVMRIGKI